MKIKNRIKNIFGLMLLGVLFCSASPVAAASQLNWTTNFDQAMKESKETKKPIYLLFTGEAWCSFCKKLNNEVLTSPEFAQAVGDKLIFVKIDVNPQGMPLDAKNRQQHQQLIGQYNINSFPTAFLVDSTGRTILKTGYRHGGGKAYADFLLQNVKTTQASNP